MTAENPPILLSLYALREKPPGFEDFRLIEWTPATSGGHPSWFSEASQMRDKNGSLWHALRRRFGIPEDPPMFVVVGFSAGSNSGLREVLRSSLDRSRIHAALSLDGLHASTKSWIKADPAKDPRERYFDWGGQLGPFLDAATEMGSDPARVFVATASDVARPGKDLTKTVEAWRDIYRILQIEGVPTLAGAGDVPPTLAASDRGAPVVLEPGLAYRVGERSTRPSPFLPFKGAQARDHVQQAQAVGPWALRRFVEPLLPLYLSGRAVS